MTLIITFQSIKIPDWNLKPAVLFKLFFCWVAQIFGGTLTMISHVFMNPEIICSNETMMIPLAIWDNPQISSHHKSEAKATDESNRMSQQARSFKAVFNIQSFKAR